MVWLVMVRLTFGIDYRRAYTLSEAIAMESALIAIHGASNVWIEERSIDQ